MTKTTSIKASTWVRVFAGFYKRIGSDGATVLAEISRDDNGTWSYMVKPFGKAGLAWQVTGFGTLTEAKRMAEVGYRSYLREHTAMNVRSS
ncbi:hypothetical protein AB0G60_02815 [Streptomyces angustmyceticus]|uniref:Uncharacterized protein n=1 Tax=Streptomyces angustmyceticus TaxID=285578 RepID=A0A5J4LCT1_9ACTN|nr:hypothetical protein [Streptomyces angustmyceticus]UAL65594.1 hypothetical protein K7396_02785 [Streptomyces angustmyceticus]GES27885.1 hypothetical protein San01_03720 [Streptomyces angustmyceticus]